METQIKKLRVQIDGLAQLTEKLHKPTDPNKNANWVMYTTKEVEKTVDNLYLAKAWLGKVLGELGNQNPYGSGYKTKEDIVPTQDVNKGFLHEPLEDEKPWQCKSHIEKVDWLRTEIEKLVKEIQAIGNPPNAPMLNREMSIARTNCFNHLCEAKFWLGFELQRIREN